MCATWASTPTPTMSTCAANCFFMVSLRIRAARPVSCSSELLSPPSPPSSSDACSDAPVISSLSSVFSSLLFASPPASIALVLASPSASPGEHNRSASSRSGVVAAFKAPRPKEGLADTETPGAPGEDSIAPHRRARLWVAAEETDLRKMTLVNFETFTSVDDPKSDRPSFTPKDAPAGRARGRHAKGHHG